MAEDEVFKQLNFRAFIRAEIWERTHRAMEKIHASLLIVLNITNTLIINSIVLWT